MTSVSEERTTILHWSRRNLVQRISVTFRALKTVIHIQAMVELSWPRPTKSYKILPNILRVQFVRPLADLNSEILGHLQNHNSIPAFE